MTNFQSMTLQRMWQFLLAIVAWSGLLLQFYVTVLRSPAQGIALARVAIFYFSFFTILTNLLIVLVMTSSLWMSHSRLGRFFARPQVASATFVSIAVVFAVYSLVLRQLWNPAGVEKVADVLLHKAAPLLYMAYWGVFLRRCRLQWKDALWWLTYPLGYLVYVLVRGALIGRYPYPFLDVVTLGYFRVLLNALVICSAFLGLSLLLVAITRWSTNSTQTREVVGSQVKLP